MKNIHLLLLLFSSSICLLCLQTLFLRYLLSKDPKEEENPLNENWQVVQQLQGYASKAGIHLFILDPEILLKLASLNSTHNDFWPGDQHVTQLGTLSHLSSQHAKELLVQDLRKNGLEVVVDEIADPTLAKHSLNVNIPVHIFISYPFNHKLVVHIVIFYERAAANFWWHGPAKFPFTPSNDAKTSLFHFTQHAGAYDRTELLPVILDGVPLFAPAEPRVFLPPSSLPHQSHRSANFIECLHKEAHAFYQRHPREESPDANQFRAKAWRLLAKAKDLLDQLGVPFWISSGTLLGYLRQCEFIPHSKDVDLGIWIRDYNPKIVNTFSTHDLPLTHWFGKVEDSLELSFLDQDLKLDIFFFYEEADHAWNGGTQARTGKKFKYRFPLFELCWTEFLELLVRVPCETEQYIQANYGPHWREPQLDWDWKSSPFNVEPNGEWPLADWPKVIQLLPTPEFT